MRLGVRAGVVSFAIFERFCCCKNLDPKGRMIFSKRGRVDAFTDINLANRRSVSREYVIHNLPFHNANVYQNVSMAL